MSSGAKKTERKESQPAQKSRPDRDRVVQDGILKESVALQEIAQKCWESKWGFLKKNNYEKILDDEARAMGESPSILRRNPCRRPSGDPVRPGAVTTSRPVPATSAGFIGWRSTVRSCTLEIVGPMYISPTSTIEPPARAGQPPADKQIVIFIG